jgi:glucokinase
MTILVADVGGTNSRLGLASDGRLDPTSLRRFKNSDYGSFYDVVDAFRQGQKYVEINACAVAMAGPVSAQRARLTNLDWEISSADLKHAISCPRALLMNDLTALGYSLGHLPSEGVTTISEHAAGAPKNDQFLVVGLGTGFNVCPVKKVGNGPAVCLEAELGHVARPASVSIFLETRFALDADQFATVEDCFSGRGLSNLHALLTKSAPIDPADIVANHALGTDRHATQALELMADMLGALAREMVLQYLPLNGLYFAGSVARGLFDAGFGPNFLQGSAKHDQFEAQLQNVPVSVIKDDAAALIGCVVASG